MAVLSFRRNTFARNVYLYGNTKLIDVPMEYVEPVKEYAAGTFAESQIEDALIYKYITQIEFDETIALIYSIEQ